MLINANNIILSSNLIDFNDLPLTNFSRKLYFTLISTYIST